MDLSLRVGRETFLMIGNAPVISPEKLQHEDDQAEKQLLGKYNFSLAANY